MKLLLVLVLVYQAHLITAQPTFAPVVTPSQPTFASPAVVPTQKPTVAPSRKPSREPTIKPSKRPTAQPTSKPTRVPTVVPTKKPSREPTAKPTKQPTYKPTHKPTKSPAAQDPGEYDMCKPKKGMNKATCDKLIKTCKEGGIVMKWYGVGCTVGRKKEFDGGCQCDWYCGFKCKSACNNSAGKLCVWDARLNACKGKGEYEAYVGPGPEQCAYQG